jgi:hypothetical protein
MYYSINEVSVGLNLTREPDVFVGIGSFLGAMREMKSYSSYLYARNGEEKYNSMNKSLILSMKTLKPFDGKLQM